MAQSAVQHLTHMRMNLCQFTQPPIYQQPLELKHNSAEEYQSPAFHSALLKLCFPEIVEVSVNLNYIFRNSQIANLRYTTIDNGAEANQYREFNQIIK